MSHPWLPTDRKTHHHPMISGGEVLVFSWICQQPATRSLTVNCLPHAQQCGALNLIETTLSYS